MKYGYISDPEDKNAYVFGNSQLTQDILVPDGQWTQWLPSDEFQNFGYFEPYACASYGTLNCIETLLRRRYGEIENYSDRYLAAETGTGARQGNSPHFIAEWLRLNGDVYETDWPAADITSFEDYYRTPPLLSDKFLPEFDFGHEYVNSNPKDMKDALKLSPLGVSVYGWALDEDGLYYCPEGSRNNHWVELYGYEDGKYWKIFDSYSNSHKTLKWDFSFEIVKRYHIERTVVSQQQLSLFQLILKKIQLFLAKLK